MIEKYFLSSLKINSKTSELVLPGQYISINDLRFEQLSRKPKGRSIARRLLNPDTQERFIIYA
jgi:hypothetical protein